MATKKTKNTPAIEAPKRGRGRPASFPGVDQASLVAILHKVPPTTRDQFESLMKVDKEGRKENGNQAIARIIQAAFNAAEGRKNRSKKSKC